MNENPCRFYQLRAERIEWFADRNPLNPQIEQILDLGLFLPLDVKDVNNYQVFIIRTGVHNPQIHSQNDVLKVRSPTTGRLTHAQSALLRVRLQFI